MDENEAKAALEAEGWTWSAGPEDDPGAFRIIRETYTEWRTVTWGDPDQARALLVASMQQTARAEKLEAAAAQMAAALRAVRAAAADDEARDAEAYGPSPMWREAWGKIGTSLAHYREAQNG